ncbi:MAG: glycosyltransferase family 4 protein [Candidatus Bathyarchaeia archaeon]
MKIAVVTGEYWPYIRGGSGVSATLLVRQLREEGILVDVYVFGKNRPAVFNNNGSTFYYNSINDRLWPFVNLQATKKLWKVLTKYDVVHVYSTIRIAALGFLRRTILKTPVVATLNGEEAACLYYQRWMRDQCKNCSYSNVIYCALERAKKLETLHVPFQILATYFFIQRILAHSLDKYFALSNIMRNLYISCGFPKDKITVIPNMYDPAFLYRLEQLNAPRNDKKTVILYAGRLVRKKGVEDLIEAFSKIKSNRAELWIAGRGPDRKKLGEIAKRINKKVKFLGFVSLYDLPLIYKKAHIFVHPAKYPEPFSRNILEAMLSELAVVASDSGASSEALGDVGIIYKTGNVNELVEKLEILINDEKSRIELGKKARKRVLENFSPTKVVQQIINEYKDVLQNH